MKLTKLNENKTLAEYEKEWEEQNCKTCDKCGTKLNDGGTCPKCDDGEEESLRESADFLSGDTIAMIDISGSMERFIQMMQNKAEALGANKIYYFADRVGTDPNENIGRGSDFFSVLDFIDANLNNKFIIFTDGDIKPFIPRINKNYPNVKLVFLNYDYYRDIGVFTDTLQEGVSGTNSEEFNSYAAAIERHNANGTEKELDAVISSAYNDLNSETRLTGPEFNKLCDLANLPNRKIKVREAYDPQEFNPDARGPIYDMNVQFYSDLDKAIAEERWEDAAREYCSLNADLCQELEASDKKPFIGKLFRLFAIPHQRVLDNYRKRIPAEYLNACDKKNENLTESISDPNVDLKIDGFDFEITDTFEDEGVKGYNVVYSKNDTPIVEIEIWEEDSPITVVDNLFARNLFNKIYDSFDGFSADLIYKVSKYDQLNESVSNKYYIDEIVPAQGGKTETERHSFDTLEELKQYVKDANLTDDDIATCGGCEIADLLVDDDIATNEPQEVLNEGEQVSKLHTKPNGEYLVKSDSGWGYTAFNRNDVVIGGIDIEDADSDDVAICKFKRNEYSESLNKSRSFGQLNKSTHYGKDYDDEFTLMGY